MSKPICGDPAATEYTLLGGCIGAEEDATKQVILRLTTTDPCVAAWWESLKQDGARAARDGEFGAPDELVHQPIRLMNRLKVQLMKELPDVWGNERSRQR